MANKLSDIDLSNLVRNQKNEVLKPIFNNVCPLHLPDSFGRTVLHLAAKYGNIELIKHLLEYSCCSIDKRDSKEMTPLLTAIFNNQFEATKLLLSAQPKIHAKKAFDLIPMLKIIIYKKAPGYVIQEFIAYLRKSGVTIVKIVGMLQRAKCSLRYALKFNNPLILRFLIERYEPISFEESSILVRKAMASTSPESVANLIVLITAGLGNIARESIFLRDLHLEVEGWFWVNASYVQSLVKQMMEFNAINRQFTLYLAGVFEKSNKTAIKTWLETGVHTHVKQKFKRDLLAHLFGNEKVKAIDMVEKMKLKLDVCGKSNGGFSALHFAVMNDRTKNVEFLLENGADPNFRSDLAMTPLFIAHDKQCVKLLLQYGADVQAFDVEGLSIIEVNHCSETHKLVLAHLAMIEAKGEDVNSEMYEKINSNRRFKKFYEKCQSQMPEMKRRMIFQSVTLFDALTDDPENIAKFMVNRENRVRSMDWYYECSIERYFFQILKKNLKKAVKIYELKCKAARIIARTIRVCDAEHLVVRKIVGYLCYEDLLVFE